MKALQNGKRLDDVQEEFKRIQEMTQASTGCGGCYHKVLDIISQELSR
jgi:NAD(P)H-nitrite reductase large subunit